jgi:hypothetical protein
MAMTSGEMFLPRLTARSREARTFLTSASTSSERSGAADSGSEESFARRYSPASSIDSTRARARPCTSMRMRPSGSLSIRMMTATVPVTYRSSPAGSSLSRSRCETRKIMRFSPSASSTARMDFSRETKSGTIMKG